MIDDPFLKAMVGIGLLVFVSAVTILLGSGIVFADQAISVNITNGTVYVKFGNLTVVDFNTTIVNLGWINNTYFGCAYSCLYANSPDIECKKIRVRIFDGTVLKYQADFVPSVNNTDLCPPDLKGMCVGVAIFNLTSFSDNPRIIVVNLDNNETKGPFTFEFPYKGPPLTGYAKFIPILIPYGVLISIAGRLGMKNVGIGLVIYGLLIPTLSVIGVSVKNLMLASSISVILGAILIWMSNQ